jgi:protein SCO1/2
MRAVLVALALLLAPAAVLPHGTEAPAPLARIGPAPDFTLTGLDGRRVASADLRGRVLAIDFLYTSCPDVCPLVTAKLAEVQDALGARFGRDVVFLSVTVDPGRDTPARLAAYAGDLGVNPAGWHFLTGSVAEVERVARAFGVLVARAPSGGVSHAPALSVIDRAGHLRVQYLGERFDPDELLHDLEGLVAEKETP